MLNLVENTPSFVFAPTLNPRLGFYLFGLPQTSKKPKRFDC